MNYKNIKDKAKDDINLIILENKGIITNEEHNNLLTYFYALSLKPSFSTVIKGKQSCLYNRYEIINNYYNIYLKYYKVKKNSKRYKAITKLVKYLEKTK